ncbi:MAG: hypothetical protein FJ033_15275 [Chloroflexi bacterium]|nr:hypothetical protein [Chloroflexota bacterium]
MSSVDVMGPGTPTPMTLSPRSLGRGKSLQYSAKNERVQADVGKAGPGQNLAASFQPRPPLRPPGVSGLGDKGSFIDTQA